MNKIYICVIIPAILVIYFEFLGRWLAQKLKLSNLVFYFPIGLFLVQAFSFPLSLLTNLNASFYILLAIYLVLFCLSLVLIIKDFKYFRIDIKLLILLIVFALILSLYSLNTTLGDLDGFDTILYLNMTTQNIGLNSLNSKDVFLNGAPEFVMTYYTCETYYYFAGVILYIFGKIASLLSIEFFYSTSFIWIFQILFNLVFSSILIEIISMFYKKPSVCVVVPLLFVFGKLYYNNAFGFYGNSFYTLSLSYASIYLIDYLQKKNFNSLLIVFMCFLSACSFTSSGIYTLLFAMIGIYFIAHDEKKLIKLYSLLVIFPLYNAMNMERHHFLIVYVMPIVISSLIYFFGEKISSFLSKRNLLKYLLIALFGLFFVLSRFYSDGLFDFSGLLNNLSQSRDMTLNYFFYDDQFIIVLYKVFILFIILASLIFKYKNKYVQFIWILIIVLFNPFCCNFINHYISVYYRAYDIFINPFSIAYLADLLLEIINNKKIAYSISIVVALAFAFSTDYLTPMYYHDSFIPNKEYDNFYKMSKDQIDIIKELKSQTTYFGIQNPYIITDNILTQSMIPNGKYLIAKDTFKDSKWTNSEIRLFEIFYPTDYLGNHIVKEPDYYNMKEYLIDANIDFLVIDKKAECFDKENNNYISLQYMVYNQCNINPKYENESYALYYLK